MSIERVAIIFDNMLRPETTGLYCRRALGRLVEVEHFLARELPRLPRRGFDLYLQIDDGLSFGMPADLHPSAYWAIDTHVDFERALRQSQRVDCVFAAQRDGAEKLRHSGIDTAMWLPLACDTEIHTRHDVANQFDVCFVGNVFPGPRAELLERIRREFSRTFIGRCYLDEMARTYSASKIVFNRSLASDVNMRVFEALACGSLLVTNDLAENGQADLFRDGVHLATYRDADELVEKIRYYLAHDEERERIAAAGRREVVSRHTYEVRMRSILARVEQHQRALTLTLSQREREHRDVPPGGSLNRETLADATPPNPPLRRGGMRCAAPTHPLRSGGMTQTRSCLDKESCYFEFARPDVLALIPETARRILDIGCGAGRLGASIKARQAAEVVGVELTPHAAELARKRLDHVVVGNIEEGDADFPDGRFDCVICADVLEHLRAPEKALASIRRWLAPGGTLVASIPNVANHTVVRSLLEGNWTYESAGLLDQDHVRFFTRREIEKLLFRAGFTISDLRIVPGDGFAQWEEGGRSPRVALGPLEINTASAESALEFFAYQYLVVASPKKPVDDSLTSIILVTHNQLDYTRLCVDSIRVRTDEPYELIFVDNGSTDGTVEYLRSLDGATVIAHRENRGFPAGANAGIRAARGTNMLLLNNDTVVTTGWLRRLLDALQRAPDVGLVGPCSNQVSGEQQVAAGYDRLESLDGFAWEWGKQHAGQRVPVDRLVGFCLLFRREVVDRIGLLDEQFGIGNFEDDDFCRRAIQAGFRAEIAVDAFVHHFGGRTFVGSGVDFVALMAENQRKYEAKWGAAQRVEGGDTSSAPGSAWERDARQPPPAATQFGPAIDYKSRQSLDGSAFPGGAWEREIRNPKSQIRNPSLSLCMIVRDNETTIGPCLASIRPWVDEIVVVDTGSKDRTPEICREYGARMFEFPWCDDFSAARNESLKHARGEWIFWMDSDDTIPEECGRKLRSLVDSLVAESLRDSAPESTDLQPRPSHGSGRATPSSHGVCEPQDQVEGTEVAADRSSPEVGSHDDAASSHGVTRLHVVGYIMQVHCPGAGDEGRHDVTVVDHVKLIRNRPDLRFEGRIHEQLLPAIRRAGGEVAWTDIYVVHSGSDHSPEGFQRKLERDLRILSRELAERPEHPFVLFNLGMTYADAKQYDAAIDFLTRCIAVSTPDESHLRKAYALLVSSLGQAGRHDEAWLKCEAGRALYPDDKELLFRCAMLHHHFGRLADAEQTYLAVLTRREERHFTSVDQQLAGTKTRHNLAIVYDDMGLHEKSAEQWRTIVGEEPDYLPAWRGLGESLLKQGREERVAQFVQELLAQPGLRTTAKVLESRMFVQRGDYAAARRALEAAPDDAPDATEALQELCRLLFEHGEPAEAEIVLRRLTVREPHDPAAWHNLGTVYCQLSRFDDAAGAYRKSLELRPHAEPTRRQLEFAVSRAPRSSAVHAARAV